MSNLLKIFLVFAFFFSARTGIFAQELVEKQRSVADRFSQLEQVLLRMSEASATSNPRRSALLKKVLLLSKDKLLAVRLDNIVQILEQRQLTEAVSGQEQVEKDLLELLRLLESENRDQRRAAEKEKIKQMLRDLEEMIHQEKALKANTAQKENEQLTPLENEQRRVRLKAQTLRDQMTDKDSEAKSDKKSDDDPDKESGQKSDDDSDKKETDQKSDDKDDQKSNEKSSDGEKPQEPQGTPAEQAVQKAVGRMKQAEKNLRNAEKSGALEDQEEAVAELQRAKAELEKILRQLREEELMQTLEKLEARFKRMLRVEQSVRSQTEKLGTEELETGTENQRQIRIQSNRIAADQQTVLDDADAALILLREDGTAQAMVESLLQARFDMTDAKSRLDRTELGSATLAVEDSVIDALQEMLDAISLAIKEAEKRQEQQKQGAPAAGAPGGEEEKLIQLLSELRMIRSMQERVNQRTERYEKELDDLKNRPDADLDDLRSKVEELARQQNRISRILHEMKTRIEN